MINYGMDYIAQIGTLAISLIICAMIVYVWNRLARPIIEREGMLQRVKMALYDVELEKFCKENKVDYSKIDVKLDACYKRKQGKLQKRLEEIEEGL